VVAAPHGRRACPEPGSGYPGVALVLLSLAAARGFPAWNGGIGGAIAFALGFATGGYATHREAGPERRVLWGAAYGALALATYGTLLVADPALSPIVNRYPALADAAFGIGAIGVILWSIAGLLWERERRGRRANLLGSFAFGGMFLGYIGLIGGSWAPAGVVALAVGLIAFLAAIAMRLLEWAR
jgi:hypothetical protein